MTDRLDAITEALDSAPGLLEHWRTDDVRWLVAEVRRLRQRHAEAVRATWNESWKAASGFKATESAWCSEAWLASEAKAALEEKA